MRVVNRKGPIRSRRALSAFNLTGALCATPPPTDLMQTAIQRSAGRPRDANIRRAVSLASFGYF